MVNGKGQIAWSAAYRAYGNLAVAFVESVPQPLRFQGQYFDVESGLHYNRYRYYSPETARFIIPDPIGLAGGLNQTQYVPNPTGWVDPLGLTSVPGDCPETFGKYRPDRPLPRDSYGNPVPDVELPHTQLGTKKGRKGEYTQAREWGYDDNGKLVPIRDIDFTDHGRPKEHPNPHQHDYLPNPTGGTPQHGPAVELVMPK
ncbi:RHS repeat-associated core domain-containing protein [Serratia fonticola]|uniref:RHS repeat-associated core domain-containing protein n=1 Tax=Serratia fonticola TaxID=47917 RepID=UPI001419ADEA|nr:RHS repeat-associated core domain-containing protein [Serratia fonticola]